MILCAICYVEGYQLATFINAIPSISKLSISFI